MKRNLHKCSLTLRHIGHTRTNNGYFKLVEALVQTHSCFFSQSINARGLPLSACHCLAALPSKMCAFNSLMQQNACYLNIKWTFAGLLPRHCYAIKTNSKQSARDFRNPPLQANEVTWVNCKPITAWHYNCEPDSCAVWVSYEDASPASPPLCPRLLDTHVDLEKHCSLLREFESRVWWRWCIKLDRYWGHAVTLDCGMAYEHVLQWNLHFACAAGRINLPTHVSNL